MKITFPSDVNANVNMMPIIIGDPSTVPVELRGYQPMIDQCRFEHGKVVYLTVVESIVRPGEFNRRPGIHTDATRAFGWGGGGWGGARNIGGPRFGGEFGGASGIYMASSDGACRLWDYEASEDDVDELGAMLVEPRGIAHTCEPNTLYHIGDRTPHESLPATRTHLRQFFRLVGPDIGAWWAKHSTPSPFGVQPCAPVLTHSKLGALS